MMLARRGMVVVVVVVVVAGDAQRQVTLVHEVQLVYIERSSLSSGYKTRL